MTRLSPDLRVIDTHVHVWKIDSPWMKWIDDRPEHWDIVRRDFAWETLRGELDANGIAELILVQACPVPAETRMLLELAARQPTVRGVVGWATLTSAQATEADLASFDDVGAAKLVGIRNNHRWAPDGDVIATSQAIDSCRLLAARGLPLDLHVPDYRDLPVVLRLIERVPDGVYVIDHLGKPLLDAPATFDAWAASMSALAQHPNVYVKYSGWATFVRRTLASDVRRHVELVLERFGPARIMFGSNWPVALLGGDYRHTYRATIEALGDLPAADLQNIFRGTAERCYLTRQPAAQAIARL